MMFKTILGFLGMPGGYSTPEMNGLKSAIESEKTGTAYSVIQAQKPQACELIYTESNSLAFVMLTLTP